MNLKTNEYGKIEYYDCPHYIHNHKSKEIAEEIRTFMKEVKKW